MTEAVRVALADWLEGLGQHTTDAYLDEGSRAVIRAAVEGIPEATEWNDMTRKRIPLPGWIIVDGGLMRRTTLLSALTGAGRGA